MKSKRTLKICVDIAMITALLFLMAYSLIGETAHEWIGIAMLILFVMHHMLNSRWARNIFNGKYIVVRVWQDLCSVELFYHGMYSLFCLFEQDKVGREQCICYALIGDL